MANTYFRFKQFQVNQEHCAMKVSTDACLFGAWVAARATGKTRILDIGAGTGLLMLMTAQKTNAVIDGIEIDEDCVKQLKENLKDSPWGGRLTAIHTDARTYTSIRPYDLVISNPPFYEQQLKGPEAARNKAIHSTALGLQELFLAIHNNLDLEGESAILLPYSRHEEAVDMALHAGLHLSAQATVRHSEKHPLYRVMMIFGRTMTKIEEETIIIYNEAGGYSEKFAGLLEDYYLKL